MGLEALEDRVTPAVITYTWLNTDHNGSWADTANWTNGGPTTLGAGNTAILQFDASTAAATPAMTDDIPGLAVDEIHFVADTTTSAGYTINGTNTITLDKAAGVVVDNGFGVTNSNAPVTFGSGITLSQTVASNIMNNDANTVLTINGPVAANAFLLTITGPTSSTAVNTGVVMNGVVSGSAGLALTNNVTLAGVNTYTGTTTLTNASTNVNVTNNSGLGNAGNTTTVNGGGLFLDNVSITQATLNLNSQGSTENGLGTTGADVLNANIVLQDGATEFIGASGTGTRLDINGTISSTNNNAAATLEIQAFFGGGGGAVEFQKNDTYGGTTEIGAGGNETLQLDAPGGLGAGGSAANGTTIDSGSTLLLNFVSGAPLSDVTNGTGNEFLTMTGTGQNGLGALQVAGGKNVILAGPITLGGNTTIGVGTGTLTIQATAPIGGAFNLSYDQDSGTPGAQGAVIDQAANTYTGSTDILTGVTLSIDTNTGLGTGATATVENGAALQLQGGVTVAQNLVLNAGATQALTTFSTANGATGLVDSVSGANTINGRITLNDAVSLQQTIAVDSGSLTLSGVIVGPGALAGAGGGFIKAGAGTLSETGAGANTYGGLTSVNDGIVVLAKTGGALAVPGALVIGDNKPDSAGVPVVPGSDVVQLGASNEIATAATVAINGDGDLFLNGFNQTIGPLTLDGGETTGAGALTLTGDVNATAFVDPFNAGNVIRAQISNTTLNLNLPFGGGTRTFDVTSTAGDGIGTPADYQADLNIISLIADGGSTAVNILKTGNGELNFISFAGNTYTGTTAITAGLLGVEIAGDLGAAPGGDVFVTPSGPAGASLILFPITITGKTLHLDASNGTGVGVNGMLDGGGTWAGPVILAGTAANTIGSTEPPFPTTVNGQISGGTAGLTIVDIGSVVEVGTAANTYGGPTTVNAGATLELDRVNTAAPFNPQIAVPGNLTANGTVQVDAGINPPSTATGYEIATSSNVSIGAAGDLHVINGSQQTIASLTGAAGGKVDLSSAAGDELNVSGAIGITGAGTFAVNGNGASVGQLVTNSNAVALASGSTLNLNVGLSGSGFTENGADLTSTIQTSGTAQNTETSITVNAGTLLLAKTGGFSNTFGSSIAVGGTLTVGAGTGAAGSAVATDTGSNWQLGGVMTVGAGANVTVNQDGVLNINGRMDRINSLTMAGGSVSIGAGQLFVDGPFVFNPNSLGGSSVVSGPGNVNLDGFTQFFTVNANANATISAPITSGGLTKLGSGSLTLTGANSYASPTTVSAGALFVNDNQPQSPVTVQSGGTIGGTGTIGNLTVQSGATLAPGGAAGQPGTLTSDGSVVLQAGSTFNELINSTTPGTGFSQLNATGNVTIQAGDTLNVVVNGAFPANTSFTIIQAGSVTGTFTTQHVTPPTVPLVQFNNGSSLTLTIQAASTTSTITGLPSTSPFEAPVVLTAVIQFASGVTNPGGTVTFGDEANSDLGQVAVSGVNYNPSTAQATVSITVSNLPVGAHTITVVYSGDSTNAGSNNNLQASGKSITVTAASTTATITNPTSPETVSFGQSVTASATVSVNGPSTGSPVIPTGFVDFKATNTVTLAVTDLGNQALNGNTASVSESTLASGTYTITATYLGDSNFMASLASASSAAVTISPAATSVVLVGSPNPGAVGSSVAFTATVTNTSSGVAPSGSVEVFDGATDLGPAAFVSSNGNVSTYSFSTSTLTIGNHSIHAAFTGSANFVSNPSNTVTEIIQPAVASFVQRTDGSVASVSPVNGVQPIATTPGPGAVTQVSAVTDHGQAVLFAISATGGTLWEHTASGWTELSPATFSQIARPRTPAARRSASASWPSTTHTAFRRSWWSSTPPRVDSP